MYSSTLSLTSAIDGGGWSTPRPGRFTPGKDPVPIVQEAGWAPGTGSGRVRKISPPTGIRSPDRPARSESLYRLSYLGLCVVDNKAYKTIDLDHVCHRVVRLFLHR